MTTALAIFLVAIFFVTGADSASIVMGMLSQNGEEEPDRWLVIFWGAATGAVAAVLPWAGTRAHERRRPRVLRAAPRVRHDDLSCT